MTAARQPDERKVRHPRWVVLVVWPAILLLTCGLLLPMVVVVRDGEAWSYSSHNIRQIGLAILNYYDAYHNHLPPAVRKGADGRPLLSWRVLVLPYLEEDNLYRQFKFDE